MISAGLALSSAIVRVELDVEPAPLGEVVEVALLLVEVAVQRLQVAAVGADRGEPGQLRVERHQRLVQVVEGDVAAPQLAPQLAEGGNVAAVGDDHDPRAGAFDQAALLEDPQRLAHGRAADAGLFGEGGLGRQAVALARARPR